MKRFITASPYRWAAGWTTAALATACLLAGPAAAYGAESTWHFRVAPYAWLTGIDGDVTARGVTSDVDVGFDDIWEDLDFAGMIYLELSNDRWGVFANPVYAKLSPDEEIALGLVDVETESWIVDGGFLFRLAGAEEEGGSLDLILGARYWDQDSELDFELPIAGIDRTLESSKDWIDPIVGFHYRNWFSEHFGFSVWGDVGGFDVSDNSSDLTWSAQGLLGWRIGGAVTLWGGYKAIGVDYEEGSGLKRFELDVTLHGPVVGIGWEF